MSAGEVTLTDAASTTVAASKTSAAGLAVWGDPYLMADYNPIGGAIRRTAGAWAGIRDATHFPPGVTGVEETDAYTLRVHYAGYTGKVGALLAAVDEALAPYGVIGGASVGVSYADFVFYAPVILDLQSSTVISVAPWLAAYVSISATGTYAVIINHPPRALTVDPPRVTLINRAQGKNRQVAITWGASTVTLTAQGFLGALVSRTGSTVFTVSQQSVVGTVTAAWSGGSLTITHPSVGTAAGATPIVCSHNSAYRAEVSSFSATTIVVQFRNAAGAVVGPTDDAEMKVWFTRQNALFDTFLEAGFSASIDLGLCKIPLAAFQEISLQNLWLFGVMKRP